MIDQNALHRVPFIVIELHTFMNAAACAGWIFMLGGLPPAPWPRPHRLILAGLGFAWFMAVFARRLPA